MTLQERFITTVEEFDQFVLREENADRSFEYIGGEIFEKMVSNDIAGLIAAQIIGFLFMYLEKNDIGRVMSDNTGYMIMGERYIPDASFLSYENHPDVLGVAYRPDPPDLAIEVVSAERNSENETLAIKVQNYLTAGTVVWVIRPEKRQVEIFELGKKTQILRKGATLTGGDIMPDFTLEIDTLFRRLPE